MKKETNTHLMMTAALLALTVFFAGCTQPGNQGTTTTMPSGNTVTIKNFAFDPLDITVANGATVTWVNQDSVPHQIVSDAGEFQSAVLSPGESFSRTFSSQGAHPYHCGIHPSMKGTVRVQ